MEIGDPFQIIRRFWAAHHITQNPDDPREWETLPSDVMEHVLASLDKRSLAQMRLACKTWHANVNSTIEKLQFCTWPTNSSFLAEFTSLTSLTLSGPAIPHPQQRSDTLNPLFLNLQALPKLQQLSIAHTGSGSLCNLELLTNLTSLEVSRALADNSNSSSSSGVGLGSRLEAEDWQQQNAQATMQGIADWALPGAAAAAAAGEYHPAADPAAAVQQDNALAADGSSSSSSSSAFAGSSDGVMLPAGLMRLTRLESLVLESITPDVAVLAQLKQLRRLELRGRTPRMRNGLLVATNPLPGLGCLTGLTSLTARCNYGISRLPADVGLLTALRHMDISKNMLWGLPEEMMRLSGLQCLDVSSNCLAALPEDISQLTALTYLDASNNSRIILPQGLCRLPGLIELHLSWVWSDLSIIWEGSTGLSRLRVLNAIGNGIAELPESIGGFKALTALSLSMNNLSSLPDSISRLSSLANLELSDNRLPLLPAALCQLSGLASLGLRSNCLAGLPDNIGDLGRLTSLDASMNHIAVLPNSLTLLTCLDNLAMSMNPLCSLPPGLSALKHLKTLEIYYVRLEGGQEVTEKSLGQLQQHIPQLYIFSNTMFPHADISTLTEPGVAAGLGMELEVEDVVEDEDGDEEDLLLLLSPSGSSSSSAAPSAATTSSVFSHVTAASSSSAESSSTYGLSEATVIGMDGSPSSESSSRAAARRAWLGNLSLTDSAAAPAVDNCSSPCDSDAVKSPGKDQQYKDEQQQQQQQLMPTSSADSSTSSSRVSFAPEVTTPANAGSSTSTSSSPMNWWQQPFPTSAGAWSQLAAAAAAASANQPSHLQGAWSCDLSMLAAAAAAADASAAAASGTTAAAAGGLDLVMPLRPLSKFHSLGRPLLSRYSRGGEATGSPTVSSGYGLAARFVDNTSDTAASSGTANGSGFSAAVVDDVVARPARRQTAYDD